jgi:hypothetical protein
LYCKDSEPDYCYQEVSHRVEKVPTHGAMTAPTSKHYFPAEWETPEACRGVKPEAEKKFPVEVSMYFQTPGSMSNHLGGYYLMIRCCSFYEEDRRHCP